MKLKHIVAALALCASAVPAFAQTVVLDLTANNSTNLTLDTVQTFGGLSDVLIKFDYFLGSTMLGQFGPVVGANLSLQPGGPSLQPATTGVMTLGPFGTTLETYSATFHNVSAGTYGIKLTGDDDGFLVGVTNVTATVTAVPEPESYAMLLAGLGALGFMGRRRKPKQA